MSMLAERKQKQRWSLNPRGKHWSEDSSKFGQKLLEKMGWKHGKGLGANEDGLTDHVKVNYKNDQKGMGYKETEQWTEHEDNFTQLLNTLNGDAVESDEIKVSSLHEKAENVKTRINYHKFTKGKDLSRYSEKDLANIFGRKNLKKEKTIKDEEKIEGKQSDVNEFKNDVDEGNLINKGSITDYFKKKLPQFGNLYNFGVKIGNNGVLTKETSDSESEKCVGFGFNSDLNEKSKKRSLEESEEFKWNQIEKRPKISFESSSKLEISYNISIIGDKNEENSECKEENVNEKSPMKKKKSKKREDEIQSEETVNEDKSEKKKKKSKKYKECEETVEIKKEQDENEEDPKLTSKKKKKKKKIFEESSENNLKSHQIQENEEKVEDETNINSKKKKKKDKSPQKIIEKDIEIETNITSKKKKKKDKEINSDLNPYKRKLNQENDVDILEPPLKKKKSKKSKNPQINNNEIIPSSGIINPAFDPTINQKIVLEKRKRTKVIIEYENEVSINDSSRKDDDKSKKIGIINPSFEDLLPTKTEKNNKNYQNGIDNPTLNIDEDSDELILNVTTPILKSERSIARTRKSVRFSKSNEEHIIPNNYMQERNELFDINTAVVEESIKEELKNRQEDKQFENNGFVNNGFDIRAIDKLSFFETDGKGIDNPCFQSRNLDDKVNEMSQRVESFEAKLDNDINEYKSYREIYVGCNENSNGKHAQVSEGVRLSFRNINFGKNPPWMTKAESVAKKSYKHLIKGDIIVAFKNSNLHEISGYGVQREES